MLINSLIQKKDILFKAVRLFVPLILLVLCLKYILSNFDWLDVKNILSTTQLSLLLIGGSISVVIYWLCRTFRLYLILKEFSYDIPFKSLYLLTAVSLGFAIITPFQSGEILKIEALKRLGFVDRTNGYSFFFLERLMDLIVVILFAFISVLILGKSYFWYGRYVLFIGIFISICICLLLHFIKQRKLTSDLVVRLLQFNFLLKIFLITMLSWLLIAFGWYISLVSLGIFLEFFQTLALVSLTTLINIISLIPGAVGVSEISVAKILNIFGFSEPLAQSGAIVLRIYGLEIMLCSLFHYLYYKFLTKKTGRTYNDSEDKS